MSPTGSSCAEVKGGVKVQPEGAKFHSGRTRHFDEPIPSGQIAIRKQPSSRRVLLAFSVAGLFNAVFYLFWYTLAYSEIHWAMIWLSITSMVVYGSSIVLALAVPRWATAISIVLVTTSAAILLPYTAVLSTQSDVHMLYLAVGFAMLALFPEHMSKLRIAYSIAIVSLVVICEFLFVNPRTAAWEEVLADHMVAAANRMSTIGLVAMAMAILLYRSVNRQRDLSSVAELGEHRANTDALTGIDNRRPALVRLYELAAGGAAAYAVALVDIDSFKQINDKYGHEAGDALISATARRLRAHFRQTDLVSRWGGDEFLVLLPNIEEAELWSVLERLRGAVAESPFKVGPVPIRVTLSIGVAMVNSRLTANQAVNAADQALYTAKQCGRNRVVLADHVDGSEPVAGFSVWPPANS